MFSSMTYLELIVVYGVRQRMRFFFFSIRYLIVPASFVEKMFIFALNFVAIVENQFTLCGSILASVFCSIDLFVQTYANTINTLF